MPHAIVEYSQNVAADGDIPSLLEKLAAALRNSDGVFPIGGIRVRAQRYDEYVVADGQPDNAFVVVTFKIAAGREPAFKHSFFAATFELIKAHFARLYETRPLSLAMYVEELNEQQSYKHNNLHARLRKA
jgi:5-carboxymethyl-2-hydroxymuconate isomerase